MYENCDAIPNMDALQLHRNDGKECKKMYSDPQWFFRIWRDQILAQNERQKVKKKRKIKKVDARTTVKAQKKILTTAVSLTHCYKKSNFLSKNSILTKSYIWTYLNFCAKIEIFVWILHSKKYQKISFES